MTIRSSAPVTLAVVLLLSGCSGLDLEDEVGRGPAFNLFEYFDGQVEAWGMVQDWRGRVVRQFAVTIEGTIRGDELTLDEVFNYADGEQSTRQWRIKRNSDDNAATRYTGTANDIIGSAAGIESGDAVRWDYEMDIETSGRTYRVRFADRLWRIDGDTVTNRAKIRKFGFVAAEVILFMRRVDEQKQVSLDRAFQWHAATRRTAANRHLP